MKILMETKRLFFREIEEADFNDFYELDSNPAVHKYLGNSPVKDVETSKKVIKMIRQQYVDNGLGRWAIIDKKTKEFLGWGGLKYEKELIKDISYFDIGYRLKEQYWGKGIATENAIASLDFGFNHLNLKEICAAVHVDNIASNVILKKIGMSPTKTFLLDGENHNWYQLKKNNYG